MAESFLLSSPLSVSVTSLTGAPPAKVRPGEDEELFDKMQEVKPWPPLPRRAVDHNLDPKVVKDLMKPAAGSRTELSQLSMRTGNSQNTGRMTLKDTLKTLSQLERINKSVSRLQAHKSKNWSLKDLS